MHRSLNQPAELRLVNATGMPKVQHGHSHGFKDSSHRPRSAPRCEVKSVNGSRTPGASRTAQPGWLIEGKGATFGDLNCPSDLDDHLVWDKSVRAMRGSAENYMSTDAPTSTGPKPDDTRDKLQEAKPADLQRQNDRLQLLLNLTNRITSNLELREVLRAISGNIREVMQCDVAAISLPIDEPGKYRVYAVDFPSGKGVVKEELVVSPGPDDPGRRAFETLRPVIVHVADPHDVSPGHKLAVAEGIRSGCFIPLVSRGRARPLKWV